MERRKCTKIIVLDVERTLRAESTSVEVTRIPEPFCLYVPSCSLFLKLDKSISAKWSRCWVREVGERRPVKGGLLLPLFLWQLWRGHWY